MNPAHSSSQNPARMGGVKEVLEALDTIERSVGSGNDAGRAQAAIREARGKAASSSDALVKQLAAELLIWESKFPVIWREPSGRQGMAKHVKHWIEKLKGSTGG